MYEAAKHIAIVIAWTLLILTLAAAVMTFAVFYIPVGLD